MSDSLDNSIPLLTDILNEDNGSVDNTPPQPIATPKASPSTTLTSSPMASPPSNTTNFDHSSKSNAYISPFASSPSEPPASQLDPLFDDIPELDSPLPPQHQPTTSTPQQEIELLDTTQSILESSEAHARPESSIKAKDTLTAQTIELKPEPRLGELIEHIESHESKQQKIEMTAIGEPVYSHPHVQAQTTSSYPSTLIKSSDTTAMTSTTSPSTTNATNTPDIPNFLKAPSKLSTAQEWKEDLVSHLPARLTDAEIQSITESVRANVLSQVLSRVDFVLEHRIRDSLADILQNSVDKLAQDIRSGLKNSLEEVLTRTINQEINKITRK